MSPYQNLNENRHQLVQSDYLHALNRQSDHAVDFDCEECLRTASKGGHTSQANPIATSRSQDAFTKQLVHGEEARGGQDGRGEM